MLRKNQKGQGLVEYSLILALIAIVAITVMTNVGTRVIEMFQSVYNAL